MSQPSLSSPTPVYHKASLRWAQRAGLMAVIVGLFAAIGLAILPGTYRRLVLLNVAGNVYGTFERLFPRAPHGVGPVPPATDSLAKPPHFAVMLNRDFPDRNFSVHYEQPSPVTYNVNFHHEDFLSEKSAEFRSQAADLLQRKNDLFSISQNIRQLTNHAPIRKEIPGIDPLQFLAKARAGEPLTCRYFSSLFDACARARGYTTRMLSLSATGLQFDHAVSEVYLPEYGKWVLFDCDFNLAYRRRGVWLNAYELQQVWSEWQAHAQQSPQLHSADKLQQDRERQRLAELLEVEIVELGQASAEMRATNLHDGRTGLNLELFEHIFYPVRNDFLSDSYPKGHPISVQMYRLSASNATDLLSVCPEAIEVAEPHDLYWSVGVTEVRGNVLKTTEPALAITLFTYTPNFSQFEAAKGESADWTRIESNTLDWPLALGENALRVRTKNAAGLAGEVTTLRVNCESRSPQP